MGGAQLTIQARADLVAAALNEARGGGWTAVEGGLVRGPGTLAVAVTANHSEEPRHLDLEFVLNAERRDETAIIDCVTGMARDVEAAIQQAIHMWMTTTAAAGFELLNQRGEDAAHFDPNDPQGFPGWHMIGGTVLGWGLSDESAIGDWMAAVAPWNALASVIEPGLDRPMLNGIKFYLASSEGFEAAEVRINGLRHDPSSMALAHMDWPRTQTLTAARTYTVLLHRDNSRPN